MTPLPLPATEPSARWRGARRLGPWLLLLACWFAAAPASAQNCWLGGVGGFAFGTINLHANTDTSLAIGYTCQSNGSRTYFRTCLYIAQSAPIAGTNPRYMTNNNNAQMAYGLYADAARSQLVGPPPAGGGFGGVTSTFDIPGGYVQANRTVTVYGRVPGNQSLPGSAAFQSQLGGSAVYWAASNSGTPPNCTTGSAGSGVATFYTETTATVPTNCRISQVNDLDFGAMVSVATQVDMTSQVMVRCPLGTAWNLGLGNGSHASGSTRRMRSAAGNFVSYELYRNAARSQRWGTLIGTDTVSGTGIGDEAWANTPQVITVYGRVPAQGPKPGGIYTDTVTITLTY